jgi:uncharacterized glyoxalase superfamily protein PhnB
MAARRKVGRSGGGKKKAASKPAARASKPAPKKAAVKAKAVKAKAVKAKAPRTSAKARAAKPALKPRHAPETLRVRSIMPSLTANDFPRSLAFYTETLGFLVTDSWKDESGVVRGAMLKAGSCEIGLGQDDWKKGKDRKKGEGIRVYLETAQDVDALAGRVKAAGHALAEEPADQPWGYRAFSVDDPDGFHLTIIRKIK